jgi:cytochrome c peroxidase
MRIAPRLLATLVGALMLVPMPCANRTAAPIASAKSEQTGAQLLPLPAVPWRQTPAGEGIGDRLEKYTAFVSLCAQNLTQPPTTAAKKSSYMPVVETESFAVVQNRMSAAKAAVMKRQMDLLAERYDLSDWPAEGVVMDRRKPVQKGVRVKLPPGVNWSQLASMTPQQTCEENLFPQGFLPLPHANHPEGGMVFPKFEIQEVLKQEQRDLTRFDLDFDIPGHFLPEFPPAIYLTTRPDLGDVSRGQLITMDNFFDLFNGILNPKQLEGLRLLLTPFPQQQFNQTNDRRSAKPSRGVACLCLDCHANGAV